MEDKVQSEYKATQVVEVGSSEERVRALREAYLNGTLAVDSAKLAQKILSFERELDRQYHNDSK